MSIQTHDSEIGRPRPLPAIDSAARQIIDGELANLAAQKNAAVTNLIRTPEGEVTFGSANILGVTASQGAMKFLADLFAAPAPRGRSI